MKAYVIRIKGHELSEQAATRCIKSAAKHGLEVSRWDAFTPKDKPLEKLKEMGKFGSKLIKMELQNQRLNRLAPLKSKALK